MFCHLVFDIVLPTPQTLTDLVNYDYMVGGGHVVLRVVDVSVITCYIIFLFYVLWLRVVIVHHLNR